MAKRASLSSGRLKTPKQKLEAPSVAETPKAATTTQEKKRPLKERAKQVMMYIHPDAHDQLRMLSIKEKKELNTLYIEALDMLFKAKQLPQIATPDD